MALNRLDKNLEALDIEVHEKIRGMQTEFERLRRWEQENDVEDTSSLSFEL